MMFTLIIIQNLWWLFLLTTVALVVRSYFFQKKILELKNDIAFRRTLAKKRFRVAKDLSDELSNGFNNIKIIAKESNPSQVEESRQSFLKIQRLCLDQITHLEDVVWAAKNKDCTVEDLVFKIEDYVDDVLREKGIEVVLDNKGVPLERKVGFYLRRNILLFSKEAIHFLLENTRPKKVNLFYVYKPDYFELVINCKYNQKLNSPISMAPRILKMRQLAEGLGGQNEIKDQPNHYELKLILKGD